MIERSILNTTQLPQKFCEFILHSLNIFKSIHMKLTRGTLSMNGLVKFVMIRKVSLLVFKLLTQRGLVRCFFKRSKNKTFLNYGAFFKNNEK